MRNISLYFLYVSCIIKISVHFFGGYKEMQLNIYTSSDKMIIIKYKKYIQARVWYLSGNLHSI